MSVQTRAVMRAMPGTLLQLCRETGYPPARVLAYIFEARADGNNVVAFDNRPDPAVFELRPLKELPAAPVALPGDAAGNLPLDGTSTIVDTPRT